jgi:hypothetical protein
MRFRTALFIAMSLVVMASAAPLSVMAGETTAAERGRLVVMHKSLNPAVWSSTAYDNLWKQWGVAEKPANYAEAVNQRYGLFTAPFDNHGLPMGLMQAKRLLGKGIVNN